MSYFSDAFRWLNDPLNWKGPDGVTARLVEHLEITGLAVLLGAVFALPLGVWLGHTGRGGALTVALTNASRAVPTLAALTILVVATGDLGNAPTIYALALFAAPPMLANAYVGVRAVDRDVVEAARGMGLSGLQSLVRVELPLALPLLMAGIRTAVVQVLATAPLAAYVGGGGLGRLIRSGFSTQDYGQTLAVALLVAALALAAEGLLAAVQWAVTPGRSLPIRRPRPVELTDPVPVRP
ncbi:ABC transporter permease subunit [Motilibacter sp. E257]|uniref:ABC transporter permease subunit n=1 Tax=Motilibacter deserti TaxID=2714956 RepID=A0ABX0GX83_9ACTN|nr:ABC transporter permease subunit [Motilibacter deserti]